MSTKRDPYPEVGKAARTTIEAACMADLTPTQLRVLLAVLHLTATRSRLTDSVWLAQITSVAFVDDPPAPWQMKRTREALGSLRRLGIIDSRAPTSRTMHPAYRVSLVPLPPSDGDPSGRVGGDPTSQVPKPDPTRQVPNGSRRPDTSGSRDPTRQVPHVAWRPDPLSDGDPTPCPPPEENPEGLPEGFPEEDHRRSGFASGGGAPNHQPNVGSRHAR